MRIPEAPYSARFVVFSLFTAAALILLSGPPAAAEVEIHVPHDVDRLANGDTLVTDGGLRHPDPRGSRVVEVAPDGTLVAAWLLDLDFAHGAELCPGGTLIVSDTGNNRVVELDPSGAIVWNSDDHSPFSDGSVLSYPNDVDPLPSGTFLVTDKENHRVIEIDRTGTVLWQFGETGVSGSDLSHLAGPHNADRLANGNTIVADSDNDRILEIDPSGSVVWLYHPSGAAALDWPRDADRLANGNTLITDTNNDRIVEVSPGGAVVWELLGVVGVPYDADRLADGNTLVSDSLHARVVEVDSSGTIVWQYPGTRPVTYKEVWIRNPSSGVDLYAHIHEPADAGPDNPCPAFVFVPGGSGSGSSFHFEADRKAAEGFVAVHFDPDGRGQSTNGGTYTIEDYCGFIQQDGLKAVLDYVAALPEVDRNDIGIVSSSYGITMASGMLARRQDDPPVRYLIDWEGPADRYDTAKAFGGHVPVPPSNNAFWAEREAVSFMPGVLVRYVRLQSATDHNTHITDNHHAVMLVDAATNAAFGGSGIAIFTRVNRESDNPPNRTYTTGSPPVWLDDSLDAHKDVLETLLVHECAAAPTLAVAGDLVPGGSADFFIDVGEAMAGEPFWFALSRGGGPLKIPGLPVLYLDNDALFRLTLSRGILDGSGAASFSITIPNAPWVLGTFFAQGLYVHPGSEKGVSVTTGVTFSCDRVKNREKQP